MLKIPSQFIYGHLPQNLRLLQNIKRKVHIIVMLLFKLYVVFFRHGKMSDKKVHFYENPAQTKGSVARWSFLQINSSFFSSQKIQFEIDEKIANFDKQISNFEYAQESHKKVFSGQIFFKFFLSFKRSSFFQWPGLYTLPLRRKRTFLRLSLLIPLFHSVCIAMIKAFCFAKLSGYHGLMFTNKKIYIVTDENKINKE